MMEKRLVSAYDKMTMPEGCARRIEEALGRKQKREAQSGYTALPQSGDMERNWRSSLVTACLVMAVLVSGTFLFIKTQGQFRESGISASAPSASVEAPEATENSGLEKTAVPYGKEADTFLRDMCRFMPDWSGVSTLDDYFWRDFLYKSFREYKKGEGMMVETVIGQVPCLGGTVMVSREQALSYSMLAMGVELPEFQTEGMGGGFSYADGYYRITPQESTVTLENITLEVSLEESDYAKDAGWEYCTVVYRVSAVKEEKVLSSDYVSFLLKKAENQHGFVILAKTTNKDLYSYENQEIRAVARAFGEAYFASDADRMTSLMTSRSNWNVNNVELSQYTDDSTQYEISEVGVYKGMLETFGGNPVAYVRYRYLLPGETMYADATWALFLEMEETQEGWKVRFYQEKRLDEMFSDTKKLRDVAEQFAQAYLAGDKDGVRGLMREGTTRDVLVYDGAHADWERWYVNIDSVTPGAAPEARARITLDIGKETQTVVVNLVRLEKGWVVDSYMEEITQNDEEG